MNLFQLLSPSSSSLNWWSFTGVYMTGLADSFQYSGLYFFKFSLNKNWKASLKSKFHELPNVFCKPFYSLNYLSFTWISIQLWFVSVFFGISTLEGYLMPKTFYTYTLDIYDL